MTNPTPARFLALGGASLALLASPLSAQTPPPPSAVELAQRGDDLACSITEDLTNEIGQRMAGTVPEHASRRRAVHGLVSAGSANRHSEPVGTSVGEIGRRSVRRILRKKGHD